MGKRMGIVGYDSAPANLPGMPHLDLYSLPHPLQRERQPQPLQGHLQELPRYGNMMDDVASQPEAGEPRRRVLIAINKRAACRSGNQQISKNRELAMKKLVLALSLAMSAGALAYADRPLPSSTGNEIKDYPWQAPAGENSEALERKGNRKRGEEL